MVLLLGTYVKIFKALAHVDASKLFPIDNPLRTRSNRVKLMCKQEQLDCTSFFLTNDAAREWDKLPLAVVQCDNITSFDNKLDHHLLHQGLR